MFSVIIPLYNKAHTIERTLNSALKQTYTVFEVLIVNDGSTDNGVEVIRNFTNDVRVKIIEQNNKGVSVARNVGVENATFEFVAFLDGDDEWAPNYLMKMKSAIEQYQEAGMFCCAGVIQNEDRTEGVRLAKKFSHKITLIDFFQNPHVFLHTSSTIVSKSSFKIAGGFSEGMKRNEDFAFFYSVALITPVVYCGELLSTYVGGIKGQATSVNSDNSVELTNDIVKRYNLVYANWINSDQSKKNFLIFLKYELRHTFLVLLRNKNYKILNYYLNNLNPNVLSNFSIFELRFLKEQFLRNLSITYILLTKIRWRVRGYPRVA